MNGIPISQNRKFGETNNEFIFDYRNNTFLHIKTHLIATIGSLHSDKRCQNDIEIVEHHKKKDLPNRLKSEIADRDLLNLKQLLN